MGDVSGHVSGIDVTIIIAYFIMLIAIGFYVANKHVKSGEDASIAGRKLGIFLGGIGKTANSAGGSSSVGGTSWGYQYGIAGAWYAFAEGITYVLYLPIIKRIWRALYRTRTASAGQFFGYRWGPGARYYAGLINAICYMAFVGAQIIATSAAIEVLLGWGHMTSLLVSTAVIIVYCTAGGLRAIVLTDVIQVLLILVGMGLIMPPLVFGAAGDVLGGGGFGVVWDTLTNGDMTLYGMSTDFMTNLGAPLVFGWPYIIGAIILPSILIGGVAQAAFQYQSSIQSADKAFKSFIMVPFLYIPVSIIVVMMGMCAFVLYGMDLMPEAVGGPAGANPNNVLPSLIVNFLPTGLIGLLLSSVLSATMSTASTCLICSTTCLTEDVIKPLMKNKLDDRGALMLFRICMICVGLGTIMITLWAQDIIALLTTAYAAACAGLFVPMMSTLLIRKATKPAVYTTMLVGLAVYGATAFHWLPFLPDIIEAAPLYISLPISLILMAVITSATQKSGNGRLDAYFPDTWENSPGNWEKHPELLDGPGPARLPNDVNASRGA
ncbi:MAG: sodium:solute symporter family protein [Clostridiales Family XIII bacterium]|jgi:SSS family solute:Na+ symporter|nr:sodium:solute symporter family protein [Clostridiales Family XIII bacterium]